MIQLKNIVVLLHDENRFKSVVNIMMFTIMYYF